MGVLKSVVVDDIKKRGSIKDADVSRLRLTLADVPFVTRADAEELFAVNAACPVQHPSWHAFFIDTVADYLISHDEPAGYLTAEKARWLTQRIAPEGHVETRLGLDLLVAAISGARWSPGCLIRLALGSVRSTTATGAGPLRPGQIPLSGTIRAGEVDLVRRVLTAFAGDGSIAITHGEAELLFEINETLSAPALNPAWVDLFVKAIVNALLGAAGFSLPARNDALEASTSTENAMDLTAADLVAASLGALKASYHEQSQEERALARLERQRVEIITGEPILEAAPRWLVSRLAEAAGQSAVAAALAAYMEREKPAVMGRLRAPRQGAERAA